MESINTNTHIFNSINNVANNYYYDSQDNTFDANQTAQNYDNTNTYQNAIFRDQQPKLNEVALEKLEKLRKLQNKVDMLEAEKESRVNQIYDLRQLLQKVNRQGESKLVYIRIRCRENIAHFENVSTYWSWNINSYCDNSTEVSRDNDSAKNSSFANTSTSTTSHTDIPTLATASSSYVEDKQSIIIGGGDIIICGSEGKHHHSKLVSSNSKFTKMMRCFEMDQIFEQEEQQPQQQLLLQPYLLKNKSSSQVVVAVVDDRDDRDFRDSDCGCGNQGYKSVVEAAEEKPAAKCEAASSAMTAKQ
eukprot:403359355